PLAAASPRIRPGGSWPTCRSWSPPAGSAGRVTHSVSRLARRLAPLLVLLLAACDGGDSVLSILHPAGTGATAVSDPVRPMSVRGTAVFVAVVGIMLWGIYRRRSGEPEPRKASQPLWIGLGGVAIPVMILGVTLAYTLAGMRAHSA